MQESTQQHLITNYLVEKNSNIDAKTQQKIMHILKTEIYPDPFSHITTKILEYPKLLDDKEETTTSTNSNENSTYDTKSDSGNNHGGSGSGGGGCGAKHKTKKIRSRKSLRYMTQPVTLNEIKETDEELFSQTTTDNNNTSTKAADISIIVDSLATSKTTSIVQNQNDPPPNSPSSDLSKSFNSLLLNEAIFLNRRSCRKPTKKSTEKQNFKYMD